MMSNYNFSSLLP